jgi:hypothetical protein
MNMVLLYLPLFWLSFFSTAETSREELAKPDVCRIYGQVFFDKGQPRHTGIPYFLVYQESNDAFADLIVFKEDNKLFADGPGLWYETKDRGLADFIVYLTDRRGLADFSVHYIHARTFAGCRR